MEALVCLYSWYGGDHGSPYHTTKPSFMEST